MSSSVFVVDSTFKRTQVKVTPGKYLREVLEDACTSRKLNPEEYTLKTQNNKPVELSQPFRLSGLSAGAKLQLVQASRSPSVVSVALQLPESEGGGRLNDKFASNTSLWLVLRKFEDAVAGGRTEKINLTQRGVPSSESGAGRLVYEQPCVNMMGRQLEAFTDLQKTLAQLGFNGGTVMMRLNFKNTGKPLEEAMQEISGYFGSLESAPKSATEQAHGAHAAGTSFESAPNASAENAAVPMEGEAAANPNDEDVEMTPAPTAEPVENDVIASSSETPLEPTPQASSGPEPFASSNNNSVNGISVYRAPTSSTPFAAQQEDDPSIYEPTIDHARAFQATLNRAGRNTRLLSDKELDEQETTRQAGFSGISNVVVRVRYPDQSMIETSFSAQETAADLHSKVRGTLESSSEPFELRYLGAKTHATLPDSSKRLVHDLGFRGKVLVTLVWADSASPQTRQGPCLKEEYRSRAQELKVDVASQQEDVAPVAGKKLEDVKPQGAAKGEGKSRGDVEAKMKKFLGFGKK